MRIPLGTFTCVTGVSGSGKSTLVNETLYRALAQRFYQSKADPHFFEQLVGLEYMDKVINIDQSPIGRTPRSNPATYTGAFTPIRELFAQLPPSFRRPNFGDTSPDASASM
jgi:excinuclease ABC subunit A